MRIYKTENYDAMSEKAAALIAAQIVSKPDSLLGLATGSTPIGTYQKLVQGHRAGFFSFADVRTVNLDEYVGLSPTDEQSYRHFMQSHLFDHVDIANENTHIPSGTASDIQEECRRYDALIDAIGPIDLQLLGLGHNGHIGFNEPGSSFTLRTHAVELSKSTVNANARLFSSREEMPRYALTMGIGAIMRARRVLIEVSGEDKASILASAFAGPVTPEVPASILQLHPDVVLVADSAAMRELEGRL